MKSIFKTVLSIKDEPSMWKKFNFTALMKETYSLRRICSENEDIVAFVEGDKICVMMADWKLKTNELADECPFMSSPPLYFTESSHRLSPVFRLYTICEALRQRPDLKNTEISGIFLTTSHIINEDEMWYIWDGLNIIVRSVKEMKYSVSIKHKSQLWTSISAYLRELDLENFIDLQRYSKTLDKIKETDIAPKGENRSESAASATPQATPNPQKAKAKTKRKDVRLEDIIDKDDPVFHMLGPDGSSCFSSANLPPMQVYSPMDNATDRLNEMIGLGDIKEHISALRNLVLYKKKLRNYPEITPPEISLHSIFKGSPGTGKTSVALLYASVLKEAGILSKGYLLLANGRNSFMGKWVGTEEKNVRMALAAAKGNVLMIDEAYTLASPNEMDYVRNVLPLMLQLLADEEYRDIAVVMCGYDHEMEFMLNSNPGLRSRFPNVFHFKDYSKEELYDIAIKRITQNGYKISDEASEKISKVLEQMYQNRDISKWANAREVSNLFDKILVAHANRCISSDIEGEMLITITEEDIPDMSKAGSSRGACKKIGFSQTKGRG